MDGVYGTCSWNWMIYGCPYDSGTPQQQPAGSSTIRWSHGAAICTETLQLQTCPKGHCLEVLVGCLWACNRLLYGLYGLYNWPFFLTCFGLLMGFQWVLMGFSLVFAGFYFAFLWVWPLLGFWWALYGVSIPQSSEKPWLLGILFEPEGRLIRSVFQGNNFYKG